MTRTSLLRTCTMTTSNSKLQQTNQQPSKPLFLKKYISNDHKLGQPSKPLFLKKYISNDHKLGQPSKPLFLKKYISNNHKLETNGHKLGPKNDQYSAKQGRMKVLFCNFCSKQYSHKSSLSRHINEVHNEKGSIVCEFCDQR